MSSTLEGGAPRTREPVFFIPPVVLGSSSLSSRSMGSRALSETARDQIYLDWGFVPGRFTVCDRAAMDRRIWRTRAGQRSRRARQGPADSATCGVLDGGLTALRRRSPTRCCMAPGPMSGSTASGSSPSGRRSRVVSASARFLAFFFVTAFAGALAHWLPPPTRPSR